MDENTKDVESDMAEALGLPLPATAPRLTPADQFTPELITLAVNRAEWLTMAAEHAGQAVRFLKSAAAAAENTTQATNAAAAALRELDQAEGDMNRADAGKYQMGRWLRKIVERDGEPPAHKYEL